MGTLKWDEEKSHYILPSGREFYANCGILGLGPPDRDGDDEDEECFGFSLSEGYDGGESFNGTEYAPLLAKEDRDAIADEMIQRWTRWKHWEP